MDLKGILAGIATVIGILCAFATLILFAMGKLGDQASGGAGEAKMVACATAAVAAFGAAAYISTQDLNIFTA